ncbi:MAG: SGNH/GDSL hydrolase family protein [Pseudomonadota bacterium]|nr:SGNH/GDSL hydrolase family protein [Pseudomonadota bacterium]
MLFLGTAFGAEVVVFGDSWAEGAADELEEVLHDRGYSDIDVDPRGVGGTTAEYWAGTAPTALPDAVAANPDARWVWLSIGGNDLFAHYLAGNGANNAADFDTNLRRMLDALFAAHPDVKVVSFGYDFVNFEQSQECILTAWTYFGTSITTGQVNQYFLDQIGGTLAGIAADYPNFTYTDTVWGALQEAGGVSGAPNVYLPSPSSYMSDCIHPTSAGYTLVHEAWVDTYWGLDAPTVSLAGPTDVCVGDALTLTAATSNAERVAWTVDGVPSGAGDTLVLPTETPGERAVTVRAHAGAWDAEDAATVTVWAAPAAAIDGPDAAVAGAAATFQVALEEGEEAAWSAPGGTVIEAAGGALVVRWDGPGDYVVSVAVTSPGGCAAEAQVAVAVTRAEGEDTAADTDEPSGDDTGTRADDGEGCGCGAVHPGASVAGALLAGLALARRRRRIAPGVR